MRRLLVSVVMGLPTTLAYCADEHHAVLEMRVKGFHAEWNHEFFELCSRLMIPCGKEYALGDESGPDESPSYTAFNVKEASVKEILDMIVRRPGKHRYRWTIDRNVLNLVPSAVFEDKKKYDSPLDRTIDSITIFRMSMRSAAELVGGRIGLEEGHPEPQSTFYSFCLQPQPKVTLHMRSVTARGALNALVRANGSGIWIVGRRHNFVMGRTTVQNYPDTIGIAGWPNEYGPECHRFRSGVEKLGDLFGRLRSYMSDCSLKGGCGAGK